ncbi:AraC family transcriptional regulator [Burkholderia plantarii]|uniref:AraC family transcriptional regulator n=1 Tax=Burkholderia plantarii TaxID=41899 RepID=UPI00272C8998|nr:AraC family transcriptional regulator [Burkholderia plantarii]WLE57686.1 AraC family transcriptional regulator [Burkholderia plantarii]
MHAPRSAPLLDHLLATLDLGVVNFSICDIRRGWGVRFEPCRVASLHYCLSGGGALALGDGTRVPLAPHCFVLLPAGAVYRIDTPEHTAARSVERSRVGSALARETAPVVSVGDGAEGVVTACGELDLGPGAAADPFGPLARPLVVRFDAASGLRDQFVLLLAESARPGPGSRVLVEALLKQCLVMALRRHIDAAADPSTPAHAVEAAGGAVLPWAGGLADPRLAAALTAIFERPAQALTVERLAALASMSRSAFAARFAEAFGQPPMAMLKTVRLRRAAELLATTTLPVAAVAKAVGMASRSNFSVGFQALYGADPSTFRRRSRPTYRRERGPDE